MSHDDRALDDSLVRATAFDLWQRRGCPLGSPERDWFSAVRLLQQRSEVAEAREPEVPQRSGRRPLALRRLS